MSKLRRGMPYFVVALICFASAVLSPHALAAAAGGDGFGSIAENVTGNLSGIAKLVSALSYLLGGIFGLLGLVKLYGYSQNPQQVQGGLKVPIVLIFLAGALVYFPSVISSSGNTIFQGGKPGDIKGDDSFLAQ